MKKKKKCKYLREATWHGTWAIVSILHYLRTMWGSWGFPLRAPHSSNFPQSWCARRGEGRVWQWVARGSMTAAKPFSASPQDLFYLLPQIWAGLELPVETARGEAAVWVSEEACESSPTPTHPLSRVFLSQWKLLASEWEAGSRSEGREKKKKRTFLAASLIMPLLETCFSLELSTLTLLFCSL